MRYPWFPEKSIRNEAKQRLWPLQSKFYDQKLIFGIWPIELPLYIICFAVSRSITLKKRTNLVPKAETDWNLCQPWSQVLLATGDEQSCAPRPLQHQHRLHAPCLCPRCSSAQLLSCQDSHWGLSSHKLPSYSYSYKTIIGKARTSFNCSRYMEIRIVVLDSLKIVSMNVLFRFFYVVHADKGLVVGNYLYVGFLMSDQVGGKTNTRLAHGLYAMLR